MMVPRNSGERALRALEQRMPWLAHERLPMIDGDSFALAINKDDQIVALFRDTANDTIFEAPLEQDVFGCVRANPVLALPLCVEHGPTIAMHAQRVAAAPWC